MIISSSVCAKYVLPCPGCYKYYSAALNIGVHVSFQIMIFSGYMARSGIAGSVLFLGFKGTSTLCSIVAAPIYISAKYEGSLFSVSL